MSITYDTTFIATDDLQDQCAYLQNKAGKADLAPHQIKMALNANQAAYSDILRILRGRGFTDAQIATWHHVATCNLELAQYHFIKFASLTKRIATDKLERLARWINPASDGNQKVGLLFSDLLFTSAGVEISPTNRPDTDYYGRVSFDDPDEDDETSAFVCTPNMDW